MVPIPRFSLNNKAKEKVFFSMKNVTFFSESKKEGTFYNHLKFYPLPKNFNENIESILLPLILKSVPSLPEPRSGPGWTLSGPILAHGP